MGLSLACPVHCAVMLALITLLPLVGNYLARTHWIEAVVIRAAAGIGVVTLGASLGRHRRFGPIRLFSLGLAVILLGFWATLFCPTSRRRPRRSWAS